MRIVQLLKERRPGKVPVWMMRQAGRYLPEYREIRARCGDFLRLCYTPEMAAEVTLQPIRRFGFDAAILFSDILVVPDALGQKVWFVEGEGPKLEPIASGAEVARLNPAGLLPHLAPVFETVARVRGSLDAQTALIGFCGAPWTVATYMVAGQGSPDQAAARLWAYREPEEFAALIDILTESSIAYLCAQAQAGADMLQIFDSWAGNLPQAELERWCLQPAAKIVSGVRDRHPDVPMILFPRGIGVSYARAVHVSGAHGIGIDTACSLDYARDVLQPLTVVQGNLDPLVLLAGGRKLDEAVELILAKLGSGAHIFNLGHGILQHTPPDHVAQVVSRVRRLSQGGSCCS